MTNKLYQIQIALINSQPKIWRRVVVPSDMLLPDFHYIIQVTMGWNDSHLHMFIKNKKIYTIKDEESMGFDVEIDYKDVVLSDLLKRVKSKMLYQYDFGDCWDHEIILEKVLPLDDNYKHPVCVAGEMNNPPEDCGGVWGYYDMLEIIKDPKNSEYESYIEWLGDDFNPEKFDINAINKILKKFK